MKTKKEGKCMMELRNSKMLKQCDYHGWQHPMVVYPIVCGAKLEEGSHPALRGNC